MNTSRRRHRSLIALGIAGMLATGAAAPAFAAPAPAHVIAPAATSSPAAPASVDTSRFPSEWSSPNGDWTISSKSDGHDTTFRMGTWSHRDTIRVFVTDPTGNRTAHNFQLAHSSMEGWYQFEGDWRAHYPDAGPGQYTVVFAMKTSKGWQNICDKKLGFVIH